MKHLSPRLLSLVAVFAPLFFAIPSVSYACSVINQTPAEAFSRADLVFSGRVTTVERSNASINTNLVTFEPATVWKGDMGVGTAFTVQSASNIGMCGVQFQTGEDYLVYAVKSGNNGYQVYMGHTGLLSDATDDTAFLKTTGAGMSASSSRSRPPTVSSSASHDSSTSSVMPASSSSAAPQYVPPGQTFADVAPDNGYFKATTYLKDKGIVAGYGDNTYRPDASLNRAEFVKIIVAATVGDGMGDCASPSQDQLFSDVEPDAWYAPYVCSAKKSGIVGGYDDGTFRPDATINGAESAKIVVEGYAKAHLTMVSQPWYDKYRLFLVEAGALPRGISMTDPASRGQLAVMLYVLSK